MTKRAKLLEYYSSCTEATYYSDVSEICPAHSIGGGNKDMDMLHCPSTQNTSTLITQSATGTADLLKGKL